MRANFDLEVMVDLGFWILLLEFFLLLLDELLYSFDVVFEPHGSEPDHV